ncbi:MAG: hypothetical protein KIT43_10280 [Bauldia sp.]|nr:hypothetical protein [Bauldia sp.]
MHRRSVLAIIGLGLLAPALAMPARAQVTFVPGQVWSVRDMPEATQLIIGRVERFGTTTAVHVSIVGVPVPIDWPGPGGTTQVAHMPFDADALAASVEQLIGTDGTALPNFQDGYAEWRRARGGVFTISVAEAVSFALGGR